MLGRATSNSNSQDSPRPGLGGSHHLPPYSILCASPWGPHPNGILPKLGLLQLWQSRGQLWGPITLREDLGLRWGLKKSCSPRLELSNDMLHITYTQVNRVNYWLLAIESQTINLTPDLSFGHNLCLRYPNGSCKAILDIYDSIIFQWYKKLFDPLGFDPYNCSLNIRESTGTLTPKVGVPLEVWGSIPSHSFALPRTCGMTPGLPSWPATL